MLGGQVDADDGDVVDFGVFHEDTFEFCATRVDLLVYVFYANEKSGRGGFTGGRNLEAVVFDQLLYAVRNVKVVLLVLEPHVAGLEVSVLGDCVLRVRRALPVALEHVGTFEPELALLAGAELFPFGGDVLGRHVWEHFADRADGGVPFVPGLFG